MYGDTDVFGKEKEQITIWGMNLTKSPNSSPFYFLVKTD